MCGLSLVLCILQVCTLAVTKSCDSSEHFIQKVPIGFCPSASCNSRRKKIMQLCSYLDHSNKEDESSSAKTWFPSTTGHPRIQLEPFFTLVLLTTLHLSNLPLQLLRLGCNLGALEQCDRVTPWALDLKGPWVSDLWLLKSHSVSQSHTSRASRTWESQQRQVTHCWKTLPCPLFWGRTDQVCGVLGLVTYCDFIEKRGWEKLREKCTLCHSSSDTGSEKSLLVVWCLSTPLTKLFLLRPVTQY